MAYLLIPLMSLYVALATLVLVQRPRGLSNLIMGMFLIVAAAIMAAYMILGTTSEQLIAEISLLAAVILGSWVILLLMPLLLLSLYFENRFAAHWKRLVPAAALVTAAVDIGLVISLVQDPDPLVMLGGSRYWPGWSLTGVALSTVTGLAYILGSQIPVWVAVGAALYTNRMPFWRRAVPFTIVSTLAVLIPVVSLIGGTEWATLIAALSVSPPALLLTLVSLRASRSQSLVSVMTVAGVSGGRQSGVLVIDTSHTVLAKNAAFDRWFGTGNKGTMSESYLLDLLQSVPSVHELVAGLLGRGEAEGECEANLGGEDFNLRVTIRPFEGGPETRGLRLVIIEDVTAARVRDYLRERSEELVALSAISTEIYSTMEEEKVIRRALELLIKLTSLNGLVVYLVDDNDENKLLLADQLISDEINRPGLAQMIPTELAVQGTTAGDALLQRRIIVTDNIESRGVHANRLEVYGLKSGLTVPLLARDRAVGVIQAGSFEQQELDKVQLVFFEAIGQQLAIAIDNARLHTQERRQRRVAETLREVANILSNRELNSALQGMLAQLARIMIYDRASVLLVAEPGLLRIRAFTGFKFDDPADAEKMREKRVSVAEYPHLMNLFYDA